MLSVYDASCLVAGRTSEKSRQSQSLAAPFGGLIVEMRELGLRQAREGEGSKHATPTVPFHGQDFYSRR